MEGGNAERIAAVIERAVQLYPMLVQRISHIEAHNRAWPAYGSLGYAPHTASASGIEYHLDRWDEDRSDDGPHGPTGVTWHEVGHVMEHLIAYSGPEWRAKLDRYLKRHYRLGRDPEALERWADDFRDLYVDGPQNLAHRTRLQRFLDRFRKAMRTARE